MTDPVATDTAQPAAATTDTSAANTNAVPKSSNGATPSPSPAPSTAPSPTPSPAADSSAYKIPDAYRDKPWASKIKSEEDLYKQIDNLTGLVGKKQVIPDFTKATPQEIEEYYATLRPADKDAYKFGEGSNPEITGKVADMLHKHGITAHQGNALLADYQAMEKGLVDLQTSEAGFKDVMAKSFGEKYEKNVASVVAEHKQHLSAEDLQLMDAMPNEYLGAVYRLTQKMKDAYGVKESGAQVDGGHGQTAEVDLDKQAADLRAKSHDIAKRPHTEAELQAVKDQLHAVNQKRLAKQK